MAWLPTILLGLLIGVAAGAYGGVVADAAGLREKAPADLSASATRIIACFDKLDREGRVLD